MDDRILLNTNDEIKTDMNIFTNGGYYVARSVVRTRNPAYFQHLDHVDFSKSDILSDFCISSSVRLGVIDDNHAYSNTDHIFVDLGEESDVMLELKVAIYPGLKKACEKELINQHCSLSTFIVADNVTDADRKFISDFINSHSSSFLSTARCSDGSVHSLKNAFVDFNSKKAMCDLNNLDIDFDDSALKALSDAYSDKILTGDKSKIIDIFKQQAVLQRNNSLRFKTSDLFALCDASIDVFDFNKMLQKLQDGFSSVSVRITKDERQRDKQQHLINVNRLQQIALQQEKSNSYDNSYDNSYNNSYPDL